MKPITIRPLLVVAAIAGLALAVGIATFAGPCVHDDGTAAACQPASRAVMALAVIACVASVAGLVLRSARASALCAAVAAVMGALAAFLPGSVLGLCMMQTMRCWTVMKPFALACGLVILAAGAVQALLLVAKRG